MTINRYTARRRSSLAKSDRPRLLSKDSPHIQPMNRQLFTPFAAMAPVAEDDGSLQIADFFDIPLLISDKGDEDSESENMAMSKLVNSRPSVMNNEITEAAAQAIKRYIREERRDGPDPMLPARQQDAAPAAVPSLAITSVEVPTVVQSTPRRPVLSPEAFKSEHKIVMEIIVKYVAIKIANFFPPERRRSAAIELPLDDFLMILVGRLQLSMTNFMKGIIYLFRYMDIIYLSRYLNQSNNFANYTDMGFGLKKLIVGCFRLVLAHERIVKDWKTITGLTNAQINAIVKTVIGRLNGKLNIKNSEVIRLKNEIQRFVQMMTKSV